MIERSKVADIIGLYAKHGWVLRRVLLSAAARKAIGGGSDSIFGDSPVIESDFDAAWFSRPPIDGPIAWEIRNLGDTPYALVEHLDEHDPEFESGLKNVEQRFLTAVSSRKSA